MLQIFNYNAGKGDCLRLRYTGASGISHNILIDSGEIRFGLEFEAICKQIVANHEKIDVMVLSHVDMDHLGGLLYNLRNKIKLSIVRPDELEEMMGIACNSCFVREYQNNKG